jgi:hypothetical protein
MITRRMNGGEKGAGRGDFKAAVRIYANKCWERNRNRGRRGSIGEDMKYGR